MSLQKSVLNGSIVKCIKVKSINSIFSVLHHNECLKGVIEHVNTVAEMSDWPVGFESAQKLIRISAEKKADTTSRFNEKKTVKFSRIKNQRQNSSILNSTEGLYKPYKLAKHFKIEKK